MRLARFAPLFAPLVACSPSGSAAQAGAGDGAPPSSSVARFDGGPSQDAAVTASAQHSWPPAPLDCDLALRGSDVRSYDDRLVVCVPGAYCPPGYSAGESLRGYAARLSYPGNWTLTYVGTEWDRLLRDSSDEKDGAQISLGHELRESGEDALERLDSLRSAYPTGHFERVNIQGRPAQRFSVRREAPQPGSGPRPRYPEQWLFGLDVIDTDVVTRLIATATTEADARVYCEIEAILMSLRFTR